MVHDEFRSTCRHDLAAMYTRPRAYIDDMIGQARAVSATGFGIAMRREGYNLFVLGPPRTGKTTAMRRALARAAQAERSSSVSAPAAT